MTSMDYCKQEVKDKVNEILDSPGTHFILKDFIRTGITKDPVDSLKNADLAKRVFKMILDDDVNSLYKG